MQCVYAISIDLLRCFPNRRIQFSCFGGGVYLRHEIKQKLTNPILVARKAELWLG